MTWNVLWSDGTATLTVKEGLATRAEAWQAALEDVDRGLNQLPDWQKGDRVFRNERRGNISFRSGGAIAFSVWIEQSDA